MTYLDHLLDAASDEILRLRARIAELERPAGIVRTFTPEAWRLMKSEVNLATLCAELTEALEGMMTCLPLAPIEWGNSVHVVRARRVLDLARHETAPPAYDRAEAAYDMWHDSDESMATP